MPIRGNPQDIYPKVQKMIKSYLRKTKKGRLQQVKSHLHKYPKKYKEEEVKRPSEAEAIHGTEEKPHNEIEGTKKDAINTLKCMVG